jgi:hypothetical protein
MNPAMKSILSLCRLLVVVWLLSLCSLGAQTSANTATVTNSTPEDRILVIVETSSAMQKRAENIQKLVGDTVSSGLGGDMRSGDTVGMWTFNDELYSGQFPLQRWTKATRQRVAVTMVQFLQQQHFEKTARPAVIWETLTNIVVRSELITVVIVSSGNEVITGTPFDESIAENFLKNKVAQRKANMPFVTILRAYHGAFVSFSVNMAPWPIELPEYPKEARRAPEAVAPKLAPAATKPAPPPMPAVTDYTPVYATNVSAVEPAPVAAETTVAPITPVPTTPQTNESAATKPEPTPQTPIKQVPETLPASEQEQKAPLPVVTILVAGIALLIGIMVVFIALLRWTRRSSGESLITRTMNKNDE